MFRTHLQVLYRQLLRDGRRSRQRHHRRPVHQYRVAQRRTIVLTRYLQRDAMVTALHNAQRHIMRGNSILVKRSTIEIHIIHGKSRQPDIVAELHLENRTPIYRPEIRHRQVETIPALCLQRERYRVLVIGIQTGAAIDRGKCQRTVLLRPDIDMYKLHHRGVDSTLAGPAQPVEVGIGKIMVALQRLLFEGSVVAPIGVIVIPYGVHRIGIGIDRNHLLSRHFGHGGGSRRLGISQRGASRCHHLLRRAVAGSVYRGQREVVLVVWHQALNGNGRVRLNGECSTLHVRHVHCLTARY